MIATETRPLHILLVEDDDNHANLAELAMEDAEMPCRLDRVADGTEAMAYLQDQQPDVVLLDLQLPKMGGHEVLTAMREDPDLARIPTIVLTTSESELDIQKAYAQCANSYLVKPVDFDSFNKMIRDFKFYWAVWNRARN